MTTDYLVDAYSGYGDVVAEYQNGVKQKTYTIGDDLISQTTGSDTFYFGYDGLGSTRMLFDDSASVTDTYDYTAFGEIHGETGTTDNAYKFTGEQYDNTLGQYYLRARYYNQGIGRFTQLDTYQGNMSDPATLHKYLYTSNDPVNMVDPTGHFTLGSIGAANSIRNILSEMQMEVGFALMSAQEGDERGAVEGVGVGIAVGLIGRGIAAIASHVDWQSAKELFRIFGKKAPGCFTAGTLIATAIGQTATEDIAVGEYVMTHKSYYVAEKTLSQKEDRSEWTAVDYESIIPDDWQVIKLKMSHSDDSTSNVTLLRPVWWIKEAGADKVGNDVHIDMPEMGIVGWVKVTAIRANELDNRLYTDTVKGEFTHRPVTGKFVHQSNDVYDLYFEGNAVPLGVTGNHPIWS